MIEYFLFFVFICAVLIASVFAGEQFSISSEMIVFLMIAICAMGLCFFVATYECKPAHKDITQPEER